MMIWGGFEIVGSHLEITLNNVIHLGNFKFLPRSSHGAQNAQFTLHGAEG